MDLTQYTQEYKALGKKFFTSEWESNEEHEARQAMINLQNRHPDLHGEYLGERRKRENIV